MGIPQPIDLYNTDPYAYWHLLFRLTWPHRHDLSVRPIARAALSQMQQCKVALMIFNQWDHLR